MYKFFVMFTALIGSFFFNSAKADVLAGTLTLEDWVKTDVGVIYIKSDKFEKKKLKVDQIKRVFTQPIYTGQPGTNMTFANSDRSRHNIFIYDVKEKIKLSSGVMRRGQEKQFEIDWDKDYIVRVGCYLHSTMTSYVASISSNHYDELVFDNNHPINPFIVKPVNYPFQIPLPETASIQQVNLVLAYVDVEPIVLDKGLNATYKLRANNKTIGSITFSGITSTISEQIDL